MEGLKGVNLFAFRSRDLNYDEKVDVIDGGGGGGSQGVNLRTLSIRVS